MKDETKKGLENAPLELRQEIIAFLADLMTPSQFAGSFVSAGEMSDVGEAIAECIMPDDDDEYSTLSDANAERLHEAICEGRRDDAIDILNEVTGDNFRNVATQRNLFPDRVPA